MGDDIVLEAEDGVGGPIVAHERPDVRDRIELRERGGWISGSSRQHTALGYVSLTTQTVIKQRDNPSLAL